MQIKQVFHTMLLNKRKSMFSAQTCRPTTVPMENTGCHPTPKHDCLHELFQSCRSASLHCSPHHNLTNNVTLASFETMPNVSTFSSAVRLCGVQQNTGVNLWSTYSALIKISSFNPVFKKSQYVNVLQSQR